MLESGNEMKDIKQIIFEGLMSGNINENVGIELLHNLKEQENFDIQTDIAIIGLSAKFPGAETAEKFSENMMQGKDCITALPLNRRHDIHKYFDYCGIDASVLPKAGYLSCIDCFDYHFFHLSAKEASLMDPHQRLFLQTAWEAIDDAGYGNNALKGSKTGVYIGFGDDAYYRRFIQAVDSDNLSMATVGNIKSVIASRVAFLLDLKGPSILVDTACSSSLVALSLACQAIQNNECDYALVGGVKLIITPAIDVPSLGIESQEFRIKSFDENADGIVWGEGVGAFLIKPLERAITDRDNIYAVVKGWAINNDGKTIGLTAPSASMQEEVLIEAWKRAGINPKDLSYIETHGTGTQLGDPIEVSALQHAFQRYTNKRQFCAIGSVKTCIGHLDHAAGMAGLMNAILAIREGYIPVSLHLKCPNRNIPFLQSSVYVNTVPGSPNVSEHKRKYGVSGFGLSGTNCHVVLEEGPFSPVREEIGSPHIFTVSACTLEALQRYIQKYIKFISNALREKLTIRFDDICFTASTGRSHYQYRVAIIARDMPDLSEKLQQITEISTDFIEGDVFYAHKTVAFETKDKEATETICLDDKILLDKRAERIIDEYQTNNRNITKESMYELCTLYIQGADIDWRRLYEGHENSRVSLPSYPFEATRCWPEIPERNYADFFYKMQWRLDDSLISEKRDISRKKILIITDVQKTLIERIQVLLSDNECEVPLIVLNDGMKDANDVHQHMLQRAFEATQIIENNDINHIIFLSTEHEVDCDQSNCFSNIHFLRFLVKEIANKEINREMRFSVIASYANSVDDSEQTIQPMSAALLGFAKIIEMENLNIICQCIDIDNETTIEEILAECFVDSPLRKIALRQHKRYKEELTICNLEEFEQTPITIRKGGIYVIAGGLGAIGLEVAGVLALQGAAHLIMLNRHELPSRNQWNIILEKREDLAQCDLIEKIQLIEAAGAKVHCYSVDISVQFQVDNVLQKIRSSLGQINGVIHSAGLGFGHVGHKIIEDQTEKFEIEAAPKIEGTWILDHSTRKDNLDFFLIFSSPITVTGGVGVGSYIIGNAFQSAYAAYRNKLGIHTIAVAWAPWNHTIQKLGKNYREEQQLFIPLSNFHAMECLKKIISLKADEIIVGQLNCTSKLFQFKELLSFSYSEQVRNRLQNISEPVEMMQHEALNIEEVKLFGRAHNQYLPLEKEIAQVWAGVFNLITLSIDDNYYELGGDSIIAITLVNRLNQVLSIQASPVDVLKHPIFSIFVEYICATYLKDKERMNYNKPYPQLCEENQQNLFEASSAQKRIYVLSHLNPDDIQYNEPIAMLLYGHVDYNRVQEAFDQLIQRHEILRTSFHLVGNKLMQEVHDIQRCPIIFSEADEDESESYQEYVQNCIEPFDLAVAPLFRVYLRRLTEEKYLLLIDVHHSITDGRSSEIMINDFFSFYQGKQLQTSIAQYKEYAHWHNSLLETTEMRRQEAFWFETLEGDIPVLGLPCRNDSYFCKSEQGITKNVILSNEQSREIKNFAVKSNTTVYNVFLAVLYVLLYNYTGQEDIWIGTPVSERHIPWMNQIMGFMINSIVLRNFPNGNIRFRDFLSNVSRRVLDAFSNQNYPFDKLVEKISQNRDIEKNPLFDVMIVMQKCKKDIFAVSDFEVEQISVSTGRAKVALTLGIKEYENFFEIEFECASEKFDEAMVKRVVQHYVALLQSCVSNPHHFISELTMMEKEEIDSILYSFNSPIILSKEHGYPIIHWIAESMRKFGENIALVSGDNYLTYMELESKVNSLAYEMQKRGIGSNHVVAILLADQVETVISVLAVMKAGAVFLVIDNRFPFVRMKRLLYDANPTVVLTCNEFVQQLTDLSYQCMSIDEAIAVHHQELVYTNVSLEDAAYIIYTSGTTGTPKGILVSNQQLSNQILASLKDIPYHAKTKHIFTIDFSFDPFIQVILCILCAGGCLHLVTKELIMDVDAFYDYVEKHGINSMDMVPSLLSTHLAGKVFQQKLKLEILALAGEVFSNSLYQRIFDCFDVKALFNIYGPAETVVNTTIYRCTDDNVGLFVPIGRPMQNYCVYILDKHLRPLPVNVEGEIFISGISVSLGYLNQQEQTNEKFIDNPFILGMKMYRTGDIGKWLPDGNIVFLGRNDSMVKIRGIRMEVNEIQKVIQDYSGVKFVVVIPHKEDKETYLCAYIVKLFDFVQEDFNEYLHSHLPDYMIPAFFMYLQELPYNMNGKLDIKNLPNPKMKRMSSKAIEMSVTPIEERLVRIWAKVLNVAQDFIELDKSFFEQGGNSLSIILLQKELEHEFSCEISISDLFSFSTIRAFGAYLQRRCLTISEKQFSDTLKSIVLPSECIVKNETIQNKDIFTVKYKASQIHMLKLVANYYGVSMREMFLNFYGYALADIFGLTEMPIIILDSSKEDTYRQIVIRLPENEEEQITSICEVENSGDSAAWKQFTQLEDILNDKDPNCLYPCYRIKGISQPETDYEKLFALVFTEDFGDELQFTITYSPFIDKKKISEMVVLFSTMIDLSIKEIIPENETMDL